jgi:hypothetical protein
MTARKLFYTVLLSLFFVLFFYKQDVGLNNLLFSMLVLLMLYFTGKLTTSNKVLLAIVAGTFLSSLMVVVNNSDLAVTINYLSLFLLAGVTVYNKFRNLVTIWFASFIQMFTAQFNLFRRVRELSIKKPGVHRFFHYLKLIIIPVGIVFIFAMMYKVSNPFFEKYTLSVFDFIDKAFTRLSELIDVDMFWFWVFGLLVSNFLILGRKEQPVFFFEKNMHDDLQRKRENSSGPFSPLALLTEYKTGVILFALLNLLLLMVNVLDILNVWFGFKWDGQFLKQFVHEGTYVLLLSVFVSVIITMWYFRGNLNYYKNNKWLKRLAILWLAQNAVLTLSVGIRNFWYIHYYNLAYLRIGVIFFLIFTLIGIYLVYLKIQEKKTGWYVFTKSSLVFYIILVVMTFFNWDVIIARYNFSHYKKSFVHYSFLSGLSNKALPWLDIPLKELEQIDAEQKSLEFDIKDWYQKPEEFHNIIENKKKHFLKSYPQKGFLSWNYADAQAYRLLTTKAPKH